VSIRSNLTAYLDVETSYENTLTVVGIYRPDLGIFAQMVGEAITPENIFTYLEDINTICTYNGDRFDFPIIKQNLGLDLREMYKSRDLMYECWQNNLFGGLKAVEQMLGIPRTILGKGNEDPRVLWIKYYHFGDKTALEKLLDYNREDTLNLVLLENRLTSNLPDFPDLTSISIYRYDRLI
jgi:hypothetical protein